MRIHIYIYLIPIFPRQHTYRDECHYLVTPTFLRFVPTWNPLPSPERSCIVNAAYVNKVGIRDSWQGCGTERADC